jgi:hypothetical protein
MNLDDPAIISTYGAEYRGLVQYYLLAGNVSRLSRVRWAAETSMLKTLAAKHRSTVTKMARKYKAVTATRHGPRVCFEARTERPGRKPLVARFGGIPLKRQKRAVLDDRLPVPAPPAARNWSPGSFAAGASGASNATGCRCTRSASWPTSARPDRPSRNGPA